MTGTPYPQRIRSGHTGSDYGISHLSARVAAETSEKANK